MRTDGKTDREKETEKQEDGRVEKCGKVNGCFSQVFSEHKSRLKLQNSE